MRSIASKICVGVCLSITVMGCDGITGPSRQVPRKAGSVEGWEAGLWDGVVAIGLAVADDIESSQYERAVRPRIVIRAPDKAEVNESVRLEAAYLEQGKVVAGCWTHNPYSVTVRRVRDAAEVKPESEERRDDGKLILTFRSGEPGTCVVVVRIWAAGADPATAKPKAAATCTVEVRTPSQPCPAPA